jgi:hypothetical protein
MEAKLKPEMNNLISNYVSAIFGGSQSLEKSNKTAIMVK